MSDGERPYFSFPLEFLSYGVNHKTRLFAIIGWCTLEMADNLGRKMTTHQLKHDTEEMTTNVPSDARRTQHKHLAILAARKRLNITGGSINGDIDLSGQLVDFQYQHVKRWGPSPTVRLDADFFWDTIAGRMDYRELAVLAAVYSCIGAKNYPVRITRDTIRRRMLGYKSAAVMEAELPKRKDGLAPLHVRAIGRTLDMLHRRQFFSRARANKRQTYYSVRLKQDALEDRLLQSKCYGWDFDKRRRERDANLMAKIKEAAA